LLISFKISLVIAIILIGFLFLADSTATNVASVTLTISSKGIGDLLPFSMAERKKLPHPPCVHRAKK